MSSNRINVNLAFNAETGKAKKQIQELQTLLNKIAYSGTTAGSGDKVAADLRQAAEAAKQLQYHLNNAFNVKTGNFDLSLLDRSLKSSKANITDLSRELLKIGPTGQQAFLGLAQSISLADQPMLKISNRLKELGVSLKNAVKWQLSSSIVHGFMGAIQSAYGYAQDLNESLNNIRIVTGYNVDRMAEFADQANKAAKALSTTTTEYTDASLIYFQQGLSDVDVKKRTDTTIKLANVTGQSVEETANQMTAIWNNFDDGSKSLEYYADVITALGAATASSSKEISEGLNKFSAVAESVGLSYEYASAALATVTATTRESADVVGNAFKTLFARIQGLKLGETLDDGTTLNKYSQALYQVGIDIKDQSGQLKDMNTILDEMGSKWETLGKDQQIALAQSVAGVRQYTQLIALMDNWDFFKENLGTALGSEGALTEQADIFEQGWKASIKRVEAAKEAVFKDLIDEDFFIRINNGLTNLLTGIDAFIDRFGGIKSIILSISSIIISSFANKIPEALQTAKYNLFVLFGDTNKAYKEISNNVNQVSNEMFQLYKQTKGQQGIDPESYMGKSIQYANELTIAKNKLALVDDKLSASEKQSYQSTLSIIEKFQQETLALEKNNEELKKSIELQEKQIQTKSKNSIKSSVWKASTDWDFSKLNLKDKQIDDLKNSFSEAKESIIKDSDRIIKEMIKISKTSDISKNIKFDFSGLEKTVDLFKKSLNFDNIDNSGLNVIKSFIQSISSSIPPVIKEATGLKSIFDQILNTNDPGILNTALTALLTKLDTASIKGQDVNQVLTNLSQTDLNKLIETFDILGAQGDEVEETTSTIKELLDSFNPQHTVRITEALGSLAGLAGNIVSVGRGISSIVDAAFGDNDLSVWERFSSILFGISTIIPGISAGLKSYNTIVDFLTKSKKAETTAEIASNAQKKISNALTTKEITSAQAQIYYDKMSTALTKNKKTLRGENLLLKKAEILVQQGAIREDQKELFLLKVLTLTKNGETDAIQKAILEINAETIAREKNNKQKEISNLLSSKGKIIGLAAIGLITAAVAAYSAYQESQKKFIENKKEEIEKLKEENKERKEEIEQNNELIKSYNSLITSYEEMKEAVDNGTASHSDLLEVQNNLKDKALEVAEALDIEGAAFAALTGDYDGLNKAITRAQTEQIFEAYQKEDTLLNEQSYLYDLDKSYSPMTLYGDESLGLWEARDYGYDVLNVGKSYGEVFAFDDNIDLLAPLQEIISNKDNGLNLFINEANDLVGEAEDNSLKSQMEVYEQFKKLYQIILSEDEYYEKFKNTDEFAQINEYLNKFKDTYKDYTETVKRMSEYDVELAAFSDVGDITAINFNNLKDPFSEITGIEEFDTYAKRMANTLAEWRKVNKDDEAAMASLTKEARTYLGKLEGLSEFKNISDSLDTVQTKLGLETKQDAINLYKSATEGLTDEEKTLFFKVKFDLYKGEDEIKEQIAFLQRIAEDSSIKLKIDLISQGEELITNDKTTMKDLIAWWNQIKDQNFEEGALPDTVEEFLALAQDEQLQLLETLNQLVIPEKQDDINNDLVEIGEKLTEDDRKRSSLLFAIAAIKSNYGLTKEAAQEIIDSEDTSDQQKYDKAKELLELHDQADALDKEIIELKNTKKSLEAEQEALEYTWRETLQKEAESLDIDYNKVKEYAQYLRETNVVEADNYQKSEEMALARLKQQQATENLAKSSENYLEVLKQLPDTIDENTILSSEQKQIINELAENFANLTGLEKDVFGADVITSDAVVNALEALRDGAKGAAEELAILLAMQTNQNHWEYEFLNELYNANKNTKAGETITDDLNDKLKESYDYLSDESKESMNQFLNSIGWAIDENENFVKLFESAGLEDWQRELKKSAEAIGLNYTEVQKYAELLKELYKIQDPQKAEEMALEWVKQTTALDKLNSGAKKYAETLATVKEKMDGGIEGLELNDSNWLDTAGELQKYFSMLTGAEASVFDKTFLLSDSVQQALLDMANGVEGAQDRLLGILTIQSDSRFEHSRNYILDYFNELSNLDLQVGTEITVDENYFIESLYTSLLTVFDKAEDVIKFFEDYLHLELNFDESGALISATKTGTDVVKTIEEQAKAANIAYEDVQEYAKLLIQTGRATEETAESMALSIMKQSKGFDDLNDKAEEYVNNLKGINTNEITGDQSKYINDLADSLALLIGVEKEAFGDNLADFIASDAVMAAIEALNNGVEGSIEDLILLASLQASTYGKNFNQEQKDALKNFGEQVKEAVKTGEIADISLEGFAEGTEEYEVALQILEDYGFVVEQDGTIIQKFLIPALAAGKSEIEKLSDSLGVSYDSVKKNAEILRTLYPELKNNEELSERMALAELAQSEAIKDLTDNYENYINVLNTAEKSSDEYIQAYSALKDDLTKITGITDTNILDSLIKDDSIQNALAKVAEGTGNIGEVRILAGVKLVAEDLDDNLVQQLIEFNNKTVEIPVGFKLKDDADKILESLYSELLNAGWENEKIQSFFNDIIGYAIEQGENGNLNFTKVKDTSSESIQTQAKAADINYDEVQEYAKILREQNSALKDNIKLSEKMALSYLRTKKGVDKITNSFDDWTDAIKNGNKDIIKYQKTLDEIKDVYKDVFNSIDPKIIEQLGDEFLTSSQMMDLMSKAASGDEQAWNDWEAAVLQRVNETASAFSYMTDDMKSQMTELTTMAANLDFSGLTPGADIQDEAFLAKLAQMEFATAEAAQVMCDNLSSVGVDAEIVPHERDVEGYTAETKQSGSFHFFDEANQAVGTISFEGGATEIKEPHKETFYTLEGATYNGKGVRPAAASSNKGSGGGGGSAPKHAEKKNTGDKTRYHTLQNQLEDLKAEYDSISEAADRAFGKDKLKAIDSEISKTDELINKQKEYVDAIKANLPIDKAVMDAYYTDLIGGNIQYDERGNISNYDAIQDAMFNKYNQMTDRYDEDSQEWQVFEKKYEQLEKYIEQYEETYDLLRDEEEAYQDLLRQRIDLKLEKIQYSVEVQLEIPDNEIAVLEYKLGKIEDDAFKSAEAIGLLTREAEAVYDQIQINKQGLNDVLKLSLSTQEILQLMSGDTSVLANKTFTSDQIEAIKEYRDSLLDLNGQFDDMRETIEEKVMEVFDAWNEKLDSGISKLDHYGNIIQSYKNIIDIVGKDTLGLTDTFMATLNQSSIDNAINKLSSTKKSYEVMIDAQSKAEQALEEAKVRNDESSIKMWEENLQSITEEAESAREEMLSAWEEALNGVAEQFEATIERVVDIFNKEVYTLGGLEGLSEDFSNQQEKADIMLDDYQKIYELSKLNRDINKSINDIDSLSGKQKLKKLLEQINALQEDGLEMSQYDLEYLQKTYDLRMAEIELEEARNAKNTVRLRKDNEGNWSYVYTQNMDAVDTTQQKYEDALYAMQEVSSNYIDEMSEKLISTSQEMEEAIAAIRIQDFASIDDYYAEVQRVQQQYEEELLMQQNELQKAIDNNKILYDQDWTNYHNATGYKISDTENFATTFRDTLLGSLLGSEEDTANFTDIIGSAVNTLTQGLMTGAEIYYANLEAAMNAAGTSTGNFAEDTAANIDAVVEKSIEGAEAVDQMAIEMIDAFSEITNSVQNWQESYGTAMQAIIDSNLAVIESFNQMLEALSIDPNSITVRYDLINSNNAPQQFASGGYTGEWGNYGKLAILDEKELILNQNDTTNFLKALGIAQTILDTIDLNATQASYGFGNLVPATINENNSQTIEQDVHITAEFPNATDKNEIEQAFETLINKASQYANRR